MEPGETHLESSTPRSPQHLTDCRPTTANLEERREKRQSLRLRPSQILDKQDAEPPLFLTSEPLPSKPKMSLFNLFSRPKVEKQRGYTEKDLAVRPLLPSNRDANTSKPDLVVQVQPANASARAPSAMSLRSAGTKSTSNLKSQPPLPPIPHDFKTGPFDPPPLFQAYPQSMKDGTLELSTMSVEAALKSKSRKPPGLHAPTFDATTADGISESGLSSRTWRGPKATFRHVADGSSAHVELPRKIFVLVTSGYLLQYAETGPSDRLPEKMLHLGKDSAAFACDLVPGKHYVLQVSQAVDQAGVIIANSGSLFSKLGIRTAAARRMSSSFLLVMPSVREMESWMAAIRREIENIGGKKMATDPAIRPKTADAEARLNELKKMPSQSHRYQVRRNPSKFSHVIPSTQATSPALPPKPEEERSDDDTATIDGIDIEASKLGEDKTEPAARNRAISDAPSMNSSTAVSVEQQQLNNLRSSLSNSNRMSKASQAGTVATTVGSSRANSLSGSPPASDQLVQNSLETSQDSSFLAKPPYRTMASYGLNRRRSAVPLANTKEVHAMPSLNTSPPKSRYSIINESPIVGRSPPLPTTTSPQKRLTAARSEPNLHSSPSLKNKHDSKMGTPPPPPLPSPPPVPAVANGERPESFVGDLPPPSTWSTNRGPSRRISMIAASQNPPPPTQQMPARTPELNRSKRISFSMPLKVNPSGQHELSTSRNSRRVSQMNSPDNADGTPIVHTLTAKVDSSHRLSITHAHSPNPAPTLDGSQRASARSPSARLSLFPSQVSPTALPSIEPAQRSPSTVVPGQAQSQANDRALRRPVSMQVRSDPAPFLQSVRNSTGPPDTRTAPIRAMKPSRSASNVAALASQPSLLQAFRGLKSGTPTLPEEADTPSLLLARSVSPLPPRPGSRTSGQRGVRASSSLPELDLGIPVVGLGPPAPPPSSPLPAPPPGSRASSPTPMHASNAGIDSVAGLGIRVS